MAYEVGATYVLVGPDGTRVVFNDQTDADFVGFLDPDNGVTGLDSPEIRESADNLVEADGGVHGNFYAGRRPVTISGMVDPNLAIPDMNEKVDRLLAAADAMRADAVLTWKESHRAETMLRLRRQAPPRVTRRRPKTFILPLVSADDRIIATTENVQVIDPGGVGGIVGFSSPITSPITSLMGLSGQGTVVNAGKKGARWRARIDGPITNPVLLNNTTGEQVKLNATIAAGDFFMLDSHPATRSVYQTGTADRWGAVDNSTTKWWELRKGSNDIRLLSSTFSAPAQVTMYWHDTWNS